MIKYLKGSKIVIAGRSEEDEEAFVKSDEYIQARDMFSKSYDIATEAVISFVSKNGVHVTFIKKSDDVRIEKQFIDDAKKEVKMSTVQKSLAATYASTTLLDIIFAFKFAYDIIPEMLLEATKIALKMSKLDGDVIKKYSDELKKAPTHHDRRNLIGKMIKETEEKLEEEDNEPTELMVGHTESLPEDFNEKDVAKEIEKTTGKKTEVVRLSNDTAVEAMAKALAYSSDAFTLVCKVSMDDKGNLDDGSSSMFHFAAPNCKKVAKKLKLSEDEVVASVFTSVAMSELRRIKDEYHLKNSWFKNYLNLYDLAEE